MASTEICPWIAASEERFQELHSRILALYEINEASAAREGERRLSPERHVQLLRHLADNAIEHLEVFQTARDESSIPGALLGRVDASLQEAAGIDPLIQEAIFGPVERVA